MTSNVISATQNLTNISGVHQSGKSYFVPPAKAITSRRYFLSLGCLWEAVKIPLLIAVLEVVEVVPHPAVRDAGSIVVLFMYDSSIIGVSYKR
jgi:hypothetical protein